MFMCDRVGFSNALHTASEHIFRYLLFSDDTLIPITGANVRKPQIYTKFLDSVVLSWPYTLRLLPRVSMLFQAYVLNTEAHPFR